MTAPGSRFRTLDASQPGAEASAGEIVASNRERYLVPVRQPLILLPQIQRSGGTLLTQLLDGHPQLHVHPSELHIGKPKTKWPIIDPATPAETLFESLREENARRHANEGYLKLSGAEMAENPHHRDYSLPFVFLETVQRRLFIKLMTDRPPDTARGVLDHYATAYFNAWVDYAALYRDPTQVRFWVAFAARLLIDAGSVEAFFADYPDGRLLVSVRDPVSWFASAVRHQSDYGDVQRSLRFWTQSYGNALAAAERRPGTVLFVGFEDVVAEPRKTMGAVLAKLGLDFDERVLSPTFNGMPIASDSSFGAKFGIDRTAGDRTAVVDAMTTAAIRAASDTLHASLRERCVRG